MTTPPAYPTVSRLPNRLPSSTQNDASTLPTAPDANGSDSTALSAVGRPVTSRDAVTWTALTGPSSAMRSLTDRAGSRLHTATTLNSGLPASCATIRAPKRRATIPMRVIPSTPSSRCLP